MNICLILFVFAVVCLTSSDGSRSGGCQYLIFGLQASIESLEDQLKTCQLKVDGGWSEWNTWSTCSVTCGDGQQTRSRTCTNPAPDNGGNDCDGKTSESKSCNDGSCPIDGGWSEWNTWSTCSVTCGDGQQTRSRACTNPAPEYGGNDCVGETGESKSCNHRSCPINGGWSEWNTWSTCSVTCGAGQQTRSRTCTNPAPANGGNDCDGKTSESKSCNDGGCPIDGGWSEWNTWSTCSVTCGDGQQTRSRTCTNPAPDNGGNDCDGKTSESKSCNDGSCPKDCDSPGYEFVRSLGMCLKFSTSYANWADAKEMCESDGARLVQLDSKEKIDDFLNVMDYDYWIGARKYGTEWKWTDGSPLKDSLWPVGQPTDLGGCARMCGRYKGRADYDCIWSNRYICEKI